MVEIWGADGGQGDWAGRKLTGTVAVLAGLGALPSGTTMSSAQLSGPLSQKNVVPVFWSVAGFQPVNGLSEPGMAGCTWNTALAVPPGPTTTSSEEGSGALGNPRPPVTQVRGNEPGWASAQ